MLRAILRNSGIQPRRLVISLQGWRRYLRDRKSFRDAIKTSDFRWGKELPILTEWNEAAGSLGGYFYQDQLVARWIYESSPQRHVDIGSRLDGFIGTLSVFREVEVIDIRPQHLPVRNVRFHQLDLMNDLPDEWIACTDSLSCLHTIEHFGLGRYGDPIDPEGYHKGIHQLMRMVKPGGVFYLSTQVGPQRVEFNAHRVFSPKTMVSWFDDGWKIERSAVIDEMRSVQEDQGTIALIGFRGNLGVGIIAAKKRNL